MKPPLRQFSPLPVLLALSACSGSQEAVRVDLRVLVDGGALVDATTNLGYAIRLDSARIALGDIEFTIQGEMHAAARVWDLLVSRAWAHPGHYAGGDVTGALPGKFIADWLAGDGAELGLAELLAGTYNGCNLALRRADELPADDPLSGHTAHFAGVASKGGVDVAFTAVLDLDDGAAVIGAPFDVTVDATTSVPLGIQLRARDPVSGAHLFDGVDFAALDPDGDDAINIVPDDEAHNVVRRALQSHVFYVIVPT